MKVLSYNIRGLGSRVKKRESIDDIVGKTVWGGDKVEWAYREAVGRAGGIISLWDSDKFVCSSSWNMEGAVIVNGFWKEDGARCCMVNVYAPCQVTAKTELWDRILSIINRETNSRMNQKGKGEELGPKPFRVVNAWFTHPEFRSFVENKWNEYSIEGWGGFILKEKLKEDLKEWNRSTFGNMEEKIEKHREEIWKLDAIDDTLGLEEQEIIQRNHESALLLSELQRKDSLLHQRARCNWLKNGDTNSRFFHCFINRRRKRNEILGLKVNNIWTEDVQGVRNGVFEYFKNHFKKGTCKRPSLAHDFLHLKISPCDNQMLQSGWFFENLVKNLGDGNETYFWEEKWTGDAPLKIRYPRLYHLCINKNAKINEMGVWISEEWQWNWNWRRYLFGREIGMLDNLMLTDSWSWGRSADGAFKTKEVYDWWHKYHGQELSDVNDTDALNLIWSSLSPTKVRIHDWRVLKERLRTKDLLLHKGVPLPNNDLSCELCRVKNEYVRHVLFECSFSYGIWMEMFRWWGFSSAGASNPATNMLLFSSFFRGKNRKKIASTVWGCIVWHNGGREMLEPLRMRSRI
ncbi:hypothetical protein ACS0TY_032954 [Phlomoides rotata]